MASIFIYFLLIFNAPIHGFHLSQTLIEYKASEATLQVSLSLNLDDLEKALEDAGAPRLHLCGKQEHEKGDSIILAYLKENFQISVNGELANYDWIGKEINEDLIGVWMYLEIMDVKDLKEVEIKNQILIEELEDQKNIVQVIGANKKQGYFMFRKGNLQDKVVF